MAIHRVALTQGAMMDSGDWVTLIVSVVTVVGSVLGAHSVTMRQDKRNATVTLFAKIRDDVHRLQRHFAEYMEAETACIGTMHEISIPLENVKRRNKAELECHNDFMTFNTNVFLVSLVVGDAHSRKLQNAIRQFQHFTFDEIVRWEGNGAMLEMQLEAITDKLLTLIKSIEEEMKVSFGKVAAFNMDE